MNKFGIIIRVLQIICMIIVSKIHANEELKIYEFSRNISLSIPGKRLIGHVIEEFSTKKQLIHCAYECLKTSRCRSYNYEHETHTCQINDADHMTEPSSLVNENHSEYNHREAFSIDKVRLPGRPKYHCYWFKASNMNYTHRYKSMTVSIALVITYWIVHSSKWKNFSFV